MKPIYFKYLTYIRTITYFLLMVGIIFTLLSTKKTIRQIEADSLVEQALQEDEMEKVLMDSISKSTDALKLTKLGISLIENKQCKIGIIALKKAVELDPRWRDSQWALSNAYLAWTNELSGKVTSEQKQEFEKRKKLTKEAVEKTLEIDPVYPPARELLQKLQ